MYKYLRYLFILVSLMVFTSCQQSIPLNTQTAQSQNTDSCIPPIESFVYFVGTDSTQRPVEVYTPLPQPGGGDMQIPPNWLAEADLPENHNLLFARNVNEVTELWFSEHITDPQDDAWGKYFRNFQIYNTETKELQLISAEVEGSGIFAEDLFLSPNGSIWAQNNLDLIHSIPGGAKYPILSWFNDISGQFEFVDEAQSIPFSSKKNKDDNGKWGSAVMDKAGRLWFVVPEDAIYSYDPATKNAKKWVEISELYSYAPIAPSDGNIYFLVLSEESRVPTTSDIRVSRFSPKTGQVEFVFMRLDPWPVFTSLLMDSQGRLWAGGLAYRDVYGRVYQFERSPIFLTNPLDKTGFDYRWETPEILTESSDGRLWFRSSNGLAWLDLDEQKWCWVSTSQSKVIEDPQHTLWMTAYGKLYKQSIAPAK